MHLHTMILIVNVHIDVQEIPVKNDDYVKAFIFPFKLAWHRMAWHDVKNML